MGIGGGTRPGARRCPGGPGALSLSLHGIAGQADGLAFALTDDISVRCLWLAQC